MKEQLLEWIERLTVARNIANDLLVNDDDSYVSSFEPTIVDVIQEMRGEYDRLNRVKIGRKTVR